MLSYLHVRRSINQIYFHPEKDIQAARKAGFKGIWVRNEHFAPPQAADGMIDNLTELNDLLNKL